MLQIFLIFEQQNVRQTPIICTPRDKIQSHRSPRLVSRDPQYANQHSTGVDCQRCSKSPTEDLSLKEKMTYQGVMATEIPLSFVF
ncbi:hypothetical protein TNCT_310981 [Trichonephila clavata]|uniref:Uncharacterized protein n=1 Tax=Trichonephila clavata TaxID=2740835 RepID=A0A8X6LMG7_TRICU|nr:hypothetical protein TNCT_310981 [Trichonephila clavata]